LEYVLIEGKSKKKNTESHNVAQGANLSPELSRGSTIGSPKNSFLKAELFEILPLDSIIEDPLFSIRENAAPDTKFLKSVETTA
jgi:hypothetical protein